MLKGGNIVINMKTLYIFVLTFAFASCGGGGGGGSPINTAPQIDIQPLSTSVYEGVQAVFSLGASGSSLTYQWWKNGVPVSGATSPTYTITTTTVADNGASIYVIVSGSGAPVTSNTVTLTVTSNGPTISTQPTAQTVSRGQTASFSVTAAGYPNLTYQWLLNGTAISGATNSSYTTPVTGKYDTGQQFSVQITNGKGTQVTSSSATLTVITPNLTYLQISEVSTCYYYNVSCWFEIYNPTASAIDISSFTIKSTSVDATNGTSAINTFSLPAGTSIQPDAYMVLAGNTGNLTQRSSQKIFLRTANKVPAWSGSGFVEILNASGATVDFVRFGSSTQTPVTASQWSGSSVAQLPSSSTDYGKSIVRLFPDNATDDTNTSSDWASVSWVTPAGRNDVPTSAVDDDLDGIPDSAEVSGGTFAGLDLYAMGARTSQKDVFVELDQMNSADAGIIPRQEALQKVVDSFAANSVSVHFDAGDRFVGSFSVSNFNLGQSTSLVPYEVCITLDQTTCAGNTTYKSIYDYKEAYFDLRRLPIFHYLIMGSSQLVNGAAGSSGLAELNGNDLIVTLGGWSLSNGVGTQRNILINYQASIIMHELGHNLGLQHGGNETTNYKPNYWSVMNYMYALNGLDASASGSSAYSRWRIVKGDGTPVQCSLANSPCGLTSQFNINYSNGSSSSLVESSLLESNNIGRGSTGGAYADWNMNGSLNVGAISRDLNVDGSLTTLTDYNDWANIALPFSRSSSGNAGLSRSAINSNRLDPMSNDRQPVAEETAPSSSFFEQLRNMR